MSETKEIQLTSEQQVFNLALTSTVDEFKALGLPEQAQVIAMTKKIMDKLKRLDTARRKVIEETLPENGVIGEGYSVKWQKRPGKWLLDDKEVMKLHPDKVVSALDPIFAEDYLAKAKKTKPGETLPAGVSYVCPEGKQLVVRVK